jgi:photosystem II stability/assembly factor-like uncharacterized protein
MNSLPRLLATILLAALGVMSLNAQSVRWEHFAGPEAGRVLSIARTPDGTLFALLYGEGLYRSNDDGASWTQIPSQIVPHESSTLHVTQAGTLLLASSDSTLFRSTDMGKSWSVAMTGLTLSAPLVNDSSGGVIATGLHDLYRSTDDGVSWNKLGSKTDGEITALVVGTDGRLVEGGEMVILGSAARSVRISTDLGSTWSEPYLIAWETMGVSALAATPDGRLFAEAAGGLLRSTDGGERWNGISFGNLLGGQPYCNGMLVLPDGSIAVATYWGIYRSGDGGESWQQVGDLEIRYPMVLALTPDGKILAGTYNSGIYAANGNQWSRSSRGFPAAGVESVAIGPDRTIYCVAANRRFFVSSDNGMNWQEPDYSRSVSSLLVVDAQGTLYTTGGFHSTDHGTTWTRGDSSMKNEIVDAILIGHHGDLYVAVDRAAYSYHQSKTDGLFHSTDGGEHWTTLGKGLTRITPQAIVELGDGTLFVGSRYDRRVMRLTPGDTLWQEMSSGLPTYYDNIEHYAPLLADKAENLYSGTQRGLLRSSDRGASWQRIDSQIADSSITALALSPSGRIFAATMQHGVYSSDDNGTNWQSLGDVPGVTGFDVLAVDSSGALLAGNRDKGLYRMTSISSVPVTTVAISTGLVAHPNPAGSRTTVEFEMSSTGIARLVLYSSGGEQVGVIAEEEMTMGTHRIEFDLSGYASGAYHLRLETKQGSEQIGVTIVR